MMRNRMSEVLQEVVKFGTKLEYWIWETLEELLDIAIDMLARVIELILALMNLIFHVLCFLRDLCIGTIQTFANIFHGIVNIITDINCEEIEDFAAACIVVILWMAAFKFARDLVYRYRDEGKTDVGGKSVSADTTNRSRFEWTNQQAPLKTDRDEPRRHSREACTPQRNSDERKSQQYKKELTTESEEESD